MLKRIINRFSSKKWTIAVAAGKGGTGKTTIAVNLATVFQETALTLLDCDVEAPNCSIFLSLEHKKKQKATVLIPEVQKELCKGKGICSQVCRFNAMIMVKDKPLLFSELCHSCGGCARFCPESAIIEKPKRIGTITTAIHKNVYFVQGTLDIGEALSPPIIEQVREKENKQGLNVIDAPPGTSCSVIAAVKDSNFLLLVTEPTPYGLNDLALAVGMGRVLKIPIGVVINKAGLGDNTVNKYCKKQDIPILAEIPFTKEAASLYSQGKILVNESQKYLDIFRKLWEDIFRIAL